MLRSQLSGLWLNLVYSMTVMMAIVTVWAALCWQFQASVIHSGGLIAIKQ
jgi:hypothetical protein